MKKIYIKCLAVMLLAFVGVSAQAQWNVSANRESRAKAPAQVTAQDEVNIGHCKITDDIWPYDGLSLSYDSRVGVGAILTRNMFERYIGGKIVGMYVGWDDEASTAQYDCFVRTSFTGENLTSGSSTVRFGWNRVDLDPILIPDADYLCIGFYTELKKNVVSIPFLYPKNTPNTIVLHSGEYDKDGKEVWYDMHQMENFGRMPVILIVSDEEGNYRNLITINNVYANTVMMKDDVQSARIELANNGSNEISSIEVTTFFNGVAPMSEVIEFERALTPASTAMMRLPIYCLGTGDHSVKITKVNNEAPKTLSSYDVSMIGVPYEMSTQYTHKPLIEYFVSEENYAVPNYFDQLFWPSFEPYEYDYTLVMHHLDDKYMIGDNEALVQILDLVANDSSLVEVPSLTVNRSYYNEYLAPRYGGPFHYGTPYPEVAPMMWDAMKEMPTFASVNVKAQIEDDVETITITVDGNIAENVMPKDEPLYLTVYLMEKNVESADQLFWDDNNKSDYAGTYVHKNLVREILTEYWGDKLDVASGDYSKVFTTFTYPEEWKTKNLYAVAFLNRGSDNHHMKRQVINSNSAKLNWPEAVEKVENDGVNVVATDGKVFVNGCALGVEVYNIAGAQLQNEGLVDGIYIVRKGDWTGKVLVK